MLLLARGKFFTKRDAEAASERSVLPQHLRIGVGEDLLDW